MYWSIQSKLNTELLFLSRGYSRLKCLLTFKNAFMDERIRVFFKRQEGRDPSACVFTESGLVSWDQNDNDCCLAIQQNHLAFRSSLTALESFAHHFAVVDNKPLPWYYHSYAQCTTQWLLADCRPSRPFHRNDNFKIYFKEEIKWEGLRRRERTAV